MTLQDNFNDHSKQYIFSNDELLSKERFKTFEKINLNKFDKKNNESLKNLSLSDLNSFNYYFQTSKEKPNVKVLSKNIYEINIVNGKCKNYNDDNIEIRNILSQDYKKHKDKNFINLDDIVTDFNKIFLNSGIFINVKNDSKITLSLIYTADKNYTIFQSNYFNFENNCQVIIEEHFNLSENTINNVQHNFEIQKDSEIKHNIFQNFFSSNKLYLTSNTICEKRSSYYQNSFNFSDGFVRNFHHAKLNGESSKAILKGCFFLKDNNVSSNKTYISHNAENCQSEQIYKGILNDSSKANYYSNTLVSENAQKTEGYQLSKGILLSDYCSFFSKPELRIFADDVKCSHGSTIGPVDESALYYLRSRGINKNQAMKMLISSFIQDEIKELNNKNVEIISNNLEKYLNSMQ